ncbi:uncharacterized protein LOC125196384 isoform X2 [Salvia hispanica]|uniref:uncharacterized protein LOC125196384 isoform X2 n=1 Tax=Salvia hispanica TaxID=49212 RepID=UPI002009088F|nr:uncharacterized protein LOC125196384 isoform X2 [Salvia hispanica]
MFFNFAPIMCPFSPFASVSVFLSHTEKKRTFPHPPSLYFHNFTHSLSLSIHLYLPILSFLYLHTTPLLLLPYSVFTSITIYSFSCFSHLTLPPISLRSQDHTFRKRPLFDFLYLMSKKIKGVILDPSTPYAVSTSEDDRATLKYRTLMQDYHDWQKEVDMMRSRLEVGKQRKMVLAAEVGFLRKRFSYLVKRKTKNSLQKEKLGQLPILHKQTKQTEKRGRKEATHSISPPISEVRAKKKQYVSKEVALRGTSPLGKHHGKMLDGGKDSIQRISTMIPDLSHKVRIDSRKVNLMQSKTPFFELNMKGRMYENGTALSNASTAFNLNKDDSSIGIESPLPSRAPIFDLNEISVMRISRLIMTR